MQGFQVRVALCLMIVLYSGAASGQEASRTPEITIEADGNATNIAVGGVGWQGVIANVLKLRQIPRDRDSLVISALRDNIDRLPPAYIFELVRRTCVSNPDQASDLLGLALMRIRYDAYRCVDESAKAGIHATPMSLAIPECGSMFDNKELMLASMRKLRDSKELFSSKASPWWICSHGMAAVAAGLSKKTLDAKEWLRPEHDWQEMRNDVQRDIDYSLRKHSKN